MAMTVSTTFKVHSNEIRDKAYLIAWADMLLPRLVTKMSVGGEKGRSFRWPYHDPTTYATAASVATETNDFGSTTALVNASIDITATEWVMRVDLSDLHKEMTMFDSVTEAARALGVGLNSALETAVLTTVVQGFNTGTITATNSTNGVRFSDIALGKATLDSRKAKVPGRKQYVTNSLAWHKTAQSTWSQTYAAALPGPGVESVKQFYLQSLLGDVDAYFTPFLTATSTMVHAMFAKQAAGLWTVRDFRVEDERNASARATEYVGSMVAGPAILVQGYGVRFNGYGKA